MRPALAGFAEFSQRGVMRSLVSAGSNTADLIPRHYQQSSEQSEEQQESRAYGTQGPLPSPAVRGPPQPAPAPTHTSRQPRCSPLKHGMAMPHGFQETHPRLTPKEEDGATLGVMIGMSRVPSLQLMFEIDDESEGQEARPTANEMERQKATLRHLQQELRLDNPDEQQVYQVVKGAGEVALARGQQLSCESLAKVFHGLGYKVCVRTALGGGEGLSCMENLSHQFLVIQMPGSSGAASSPLIVDIEFKEQFELAQPTRLYEELLEELSPVFIGSQTKVQNVVVLLCDEMSRAFKVQGQMPPPWRKASSMLSKWCPRRSEDKTPSDDAASSFEGEVLKQMQDTASSKLSSSLTLNMFRSAWKSGSGRVAPAPPSQWQQQQDGKGTLVGTRTAGFALQTC